MTIRQLLILLCIAWMSWGVSCRDPFCIDDIIGDWTHATWTLGPNADPISVKLRVNQSDQTLVYLEVPDNDWDIRPGMVAIDFGFCDGFDPWMEAVWRRPYRVAGNTQYEYITVFVTPGEDNQIRISERNLNWEMGDVLFTLER